MTRATFALLVLVCVSSAFAQETAPSPAVTSTAGSVAAPATFTPPQPAPEVEQMRKWEGQWKTVATFAKGGMMPDGGEAKGSYTASRGLNGHAFFGDYNASGAGGEFKGHSVRMFDPVSKKWKTWWFDSWVPGNADVSIGEVSPDGVFTTESDSENQGQKFKMRITERWPDDNKVDQVYESDTGTGWKPVMSITYARKGTWKEKPAPSEKKSRKKKKSDGDKPKADEKAKDETSGSEPSRSESRAKKKKSRSEKKDEKADDTKDDKKAEPKDEKKPDAKPAKGDDEEQ